MIEIRLVDSSVHCIIPSTTQSCRHTAILCSNNSTGVRCSLASHWRKLFRMLSERVHAERQNRFICRCTEQRSVCQSNIRLIMLLHCIRLESRRLRSISISAVSCRDVPRGRFSRFKLCLIWRTSKGVFNDSNCSGLQISYIHANRCRVKFANFINAILQSLTARHVSLLFVRSLRCIVIRTISSETSRRQKLRPLSDL